MGMLFDDLKYGLRGLRNNPGFATVAILTMALGIGANTAIFSLVNALLLRPLPYAEPERLVQLYSGGHEEGMRFSLSNPDLQDLDGLNQVFAGTAGFTTHQFNFTGRGDPREVQAAFTSSNLFSLLGAEPQLGRTFTREEDHSPLVVLGHSIWASVYGSDPDVVGRVITLDGASYTVIGVMPPWFQFPSEDVQLWAPLSGAFASDPDAATNRDYHLLNAVARLQPGANLERVRSDLATLAARIDAQPPAAGPERREVRITASAPPSGGRTRVAVGQPQTAFEAVPLNDEVVGNARPTLYVLFGTVALVLLIACANAANLMVARANARRREIVIRQALGAGRGRIARQIITESLLLSLAAGAGGVLLAYWGLDLLLATWPGSLPRVHDVGIDRVVLLFTLGISLLTGLGFGIIPAIRASSPAIEEALRENSAGVGASRRRSRSLRMMVGAQLAIALVLLVGAGLLVRSFVRLLEVDPGYDTRNVLAARIRLTPSRFPDPTAKQEFFRQVIEGLAGRPEVTGVTSSRTLPLSGSMMMLGIQPSDIRPDDPEPFLAVAMRLVGPDYFSTLRIPITHGRPFEATDRDGAPAVVIVNDRLAKRLWPNQDPLGKRFPLDSPDRGAYAATVVGVVGDIRYSGLNDEVRPEIYIPQAQTADGAGQAWVIMRAARNPLALAGILRDVVRRADATTPIADMVSLEQLVGRTTAARRFNMTVVTLFAGLAFLLAVIGVYGVTSYAVSQRTREVGLRMALGAQRRDVTRMVLGEGLGLALIGVAAGVIGAIAASRAIASMLFDVTATDLPTFIGTAALLIAAAGLATYIPARRAARVDPMIALRAE